MIRNPGIHASQPLAITVTRILHFGPTWTVKLDCGCARRGLTRENLKQEQLYVGKKVTCDKHGKTL